MTTLQKRKTGGKRAKHATCVEVAIRVGCAGLGLDSLGSEKFGLTNKLGHFGFQVGLVQIMEYADKFGFGSLTWVCTD